MLPLKKYINRLLGKMIYQVAETAMKLDYFVFIEVMNSHVIFT